MYNSSGLGMLIDSPVDRQLNRGHGGSPVVFVNTGLNQVFFFQGAQITAAAGYYQPVSHSHTEIPALGGHQTTNKKGTADALKII
jgi:hypothetical protein